MPKSKSGHKLIYKQAQGYLVQIRGYKTKYFRFTDPKALESAIAYRDEILGGKIEPAPRKGKTVTVKAAAQTVHTVTKRVTKPAVKQDKQKVPKRAPRILTPEEIRLAWETDARTYDLQYKVLEAEDIARHAEFQVKDLSEQLMQIKARMRDYENNRKVELGKVEFERFRSLRTVAIVDANYLHHNSEARIDTGLFRKLLEGMIGSRLESYMFVASLPSDPVAKASVERWHKYIGTKDGGNATVIAHELKETTITCPHCSARFERRFQWAGDTVIAAEITRWSVGKKIERLILVAGDGDFIYPIQLARNFCDEVVLMGYEGSVSYQLQGLANRVVYIDDYVPHLAPEER